MEPAKVLKEYSVELLSLPVDQPEFIALLEKQHLLPGNTKQMLLTKTANKSRADGAQYLVDQIGNSLVISCDAFDKLILVMKQYKDGGMEQLVNKMESAVISSNPSAEPQSTPATKRQGESVNVMEQQIPKENLLYTSEDLVRQTQDIRRQFDVLNDADKQILDGVLLLLMVANDNELDAAMCYLTKSKVQVLHSQGNIYHVGKWGEIPAALIKQSEQGASGPNGSQDLTRLSISVFKNVKVIIALGVCGTKGRLGDVIVSSRIDECKFKVGAKQLIDRGNKFPPGSNITKFLQYNNRIWSFQCTKPGVTEYKSKAVFQPMLSGTPLIASGIYRDQLIQDVSQESGGVEMEGIGIINGLRIVEKLGQVEFIIVKAGCDYANELKNKEWQPVAAMAAADFVYYQLNAKIAQNWFKDNADHSSSPETKPPTGGKDFNCLAVAEYLRKNLAELCELPYGSMRLQLKSNNVITQNEAEGIDGININADKMDKLLTIVQTSLKLKLPTKYKGLLKSMEGSPDGTLKDYAKKLGGSKSVPDH